MYRLSLKIGVQRYPTRSCIFEYKQSHEDANQAPRALHFSVYFRNWAGGSNVETQTKTRRRREAHCWRSGCSHSAPSLAVTVTGRRRLDKTAECPMAEYCSVFAASKDWKYLYCASKYYASPRIRSIEPPKPPL